MRLVYILFLLSLSSNCNGNELKINKDPIIIQDKFIMLVNEYCNQTIFIEYSDNLIINNIMNNLVEFEAVNSYSILTNYSSNIVKSESFQISTNNFLCPTDYNLKNNKSKKNNNNFNNYEIIVLIFVIIIFPLYFIINVAYSIINFFCSMK